jgi:ubiquinone/menaquinone biosynthesis C-methylase UbiE
MTNAHPMLPVANHDEHAEQMFVRDFKMYFAEELDPLQRQLTSRIAKQVNPSDPESADVSDVRERIMQHEPYRWWVNYRRAGQELMWDGVQRCVDRQMDSLTGRARIDHPKGSLTLDPDFEQPAYIEALDIHMMPGGYSADHSDVRQGAIMDRGGAVYLLGRNGGLMNDGRGHTVVSHLFEKYPDLEPKRILDIGCGVGPSTVAVASYFPDAEHHAIDVGGDILRYAHARAEHLDTPIHFSQQSGDKTNFADNSFDLIYSCVVMHETSGTMLPAIMKEAYRVLKPGGVMIHLEVPTRYDEAGLWARMQSDFEARYNNEPFWRGALSTDYDAALRKVGLTDITIGYQNSARQAVRGGQGFALESKGVFNSWFIASARK